MSKLLKNTKSTSRQAQVLMAVVAVSGIFSLLLMSPQISEAFSALTHGAPDLLADPAFAD